MLLAALSDFKLFGGRVAFEAGKIVLELRDLPRPEYRYDRHGPVPKPSERDLRHAAPRLL